MAAARAGVTVVGFIDAEIQLVGHKNAFQIMEDARPSREEITRLREEVPISSRRGADTMAAMHHTNAVVALLEDRHGEAPVLHPG